MLENYTYILFLAAQLEFIFEGRMREEVIRHIKQHVSTIFRSYNSVVFILQFYLQTRLFRIENR